MCVVEEKILSVLENMGKTFTVYFSSDYAAIMKKYENSLKDKKR